ncbi:lytic transglycosylase F [Vibrio sp. UCD-FRSSP16_10]|uniref:membrane-bound lytic murein transglycosylase MltF n=1 Tax=unclassified Vibrio TaxID=2614977 RepID=UPI0007FFDE63|nr:MULTISPECIES: membrane-bound lytic murein transglycosylase MltF [unclassified Vibrio]OBT16831.1 lytic transglycosylase F [Vibrio sp. UCD-FRSSP16_30]OBT21818.1 lytic transglycosylase F [Vibrio sp. UCD-FRSSP16_10]
MRQSVLTKIYTLAIALVALLFVAGCQYEVDTKNELQKIQERGVLRVGTLNNQLSYYIGPDGPTGMEYELASKFAEQLGVRLEIKPAYRLSELFPALKNGEIDIVAAGLTQAPNRVKAFRAGPAYYYVSQQVVYKKGTWRPRNLKQLIESDESLTVVKGSHFQHTLQELTQTHPKLKYTITDNYDLNDLLHQVSKGERLFTVADSIELSLAQRIYPNIALAFELTEDQPTSWYLRKGIDDSLYALVIEFFGNIHQDGQLHLIEEKYFGHIEDFDYVDTRAFVRALDSKLPKWEPLFQQYAGEFDWRLVAALAYQESHWNPKAKSPTGVRGMMMLTLPTAKIVGVKDRLDPEQSIRGGVEYLRKIVNRIPDSINQHEKIWFALASYNVGYGHVMDARRIAKAQGANPDLWSDVKTRLPLLRKKGYYEYTRYGYARGDEALNYVENIRRYYQSIIGHIDQRDHSSVESNTGGFIVIEAPQPLQSQGSSSTDE